MKLLVDIGFLLLDIGRTVLRGLAIAQHSRDGVLRIATYNRHDERFGVVECDNGYQMLLVGCTVEKLLVRCQQEDEGKGDAPKMKRKGDVMDDCVDGSERAEEEI